MAAGTNPLETSPEPEEADVDSPPNAAPQTSPSRLRRRTVVVETPRTSPEPEPQGQVVLISYVSSPLTSSLLEATVLLNTRAKGRIPSLNNLAHPRLKRDLRRNRMPKLPGRINARCWKRWPQLDLRNVVSELDVWCFVLVTLARTTPLSSHPVALDWKHVHTHTTVPHYLTRDGYLQYSALTFKSFTTSHRTSTSPLAGATIAIGLLLKSSALPPSYATSSPISPTQPSRSSNFSRFVVMSSYACFLLI